mmetsp:Transcript_56668/g.151384  ORF Transcript_56668/g.151384 Transcript_56668/m.151384 type:complete len:225 (-) Transcript_56668:176-850(-)
MVSSRRRSNPEDRYVEDGQVSSPRRVHGTHVAVCVEAKSFGGDGTSKAPCKIVPPEERLDAEDGSHYQQASRDRHQLPRTDKEVAHASMAIEGRPVFQQHHQLHGLDAVPHLVQILRLQEETAHQDDQEIGTNGISHVLEEFSQWSVIHDASRVLAVNSAQDPEYDNGQHRSGRNDPWMVVRVLLTEPPSLHNRENTCNRQHVGRHTLWHKFRNPVRDGTYDET